VYGGLDCSCGKGVVVVLNAGRRFALQVEKKKTVAVLFIGARSQEFYL
jgi:hypothetical protein